MKSLIEYITEFQGWPAWDDEFDITSPMQAADIIKSQKEFQKYGFNRWYRDYMSTKSDVMKSLQNYLTSDLDLEDKEIIATELELTGMLCAEETGFEFVEPTKTISLYTDELGDDDISIIYSYISSQCPTEFEEFVERGSEYIHIDSRDLSQNDFEKRGDKLPKRGLAWAFSTYSGTVPGYWCKDAAAKKDMMRYCGLIEFKNGKII